MISCRFQWLHHVVPVKLHIECTVFLSYCQILSVETSKILFKFKNTTIGSTMTSYLVMAAVSVVAVIVVISGSTETHAYLYPPPPLFPLPPLYLPLGCFSRSSLVCAASEWCTFNSRGSLCFCSVQ
jgi:hypothetical protein